MVQVTGLHLMQGNDDGLEEDDVFFPQRHCEATDDACEDVQKLGGAIELHVLVDQSMEGISDSLSDHLTTGHQLRVEPMEDILQVLTLTGLLGVE